MTDVFVPYPAWIIRKDGSTLIVQNAEEEEAIRAEDEGREPAPVEAPEAPPVHHAHHHEGEVRDVIPMGGQPKRGRGRPPGTGKVGAHVSVRGRGRPRKK